MGIDINLNKDEEDSLKSGEKMVIVRPKSNEYSSIKKWDVVKFNGIELLVLDVREYPRVTDLFKIEKRECITTDAKDIVEAIKEHEDRFSDEADKNLPFLAIEFSVQKD